MKFIRTLSYASLGLLLLASGAPAKDGFAAENSEAFAALEGFLVQPQNMLPKTAATAPADAAAADPVPMSFVKIPAGRFDMGSSAAETGRGANEKTPHPVVIARDFEMQTNLVTQYQWFQAMGTHPSAVNRWVECREDWELINGGPVCKNHPVDSVSWYDAQAFIQKLNSRNDGYVYRLPTEAEYEYAARAGTETPYYFGTDPQKLNDYGWYYGNSPIIVHENPTRWEAATHAVGQKPANAFGLYDMAGNLAQWTQDPYAADSSLSPDRAVRGCSYLDDAKRCRSAARTNDAFGGKSGWLDTGFRLVREVK